MTEKLDTKNNLKNNTNHNPKSNSKAPDPKTHRNPLMAASPEDLKSRATDAGFNALFQKILPCFNVLHPEALKNAMRVIADSPAYSKARNPKNYMIKALINEGFIPKRDLKDSKPRKNHNNI